MSFSGFENEDKIIEALNGKDLESLNSNLKQLIRSSFKNYNIDKKSYLNSIKE